MRRADNPIHAITAAQAIIAAWDNWADDQGREFNGSDDVLQTAVAHAAVLLAFNRVPRDFRKVLRDACAVISADPARQHDHYVPNLSFDEAIEPLRAYVKRMTNPCPLEELLAEDERALDAKLA